MSRHFGEWSGEPEHDEEAEVQAELAEIAERERIEAGAEEFYNNIFWSPENDK